MVSTTVGLWLVAQMVIEVLLCCIILYYVWRERNSRQERRKEKEKTRALLKSLDRLVAESENLEEKHYGLLDLWEKIEKRAADLESAIDEYEKKLKTQDSSREGKKGKAEYGTESYEKTLCLIEKGLTAGEIAQEVGLPKGEIELIMHLRGQ